MRQAVMRLSTAIEIAANAAHRWREQYKNWKDEDTFADGTTKEQVNNQLNSIRHTPEEITRVLNSGWAYPRCSCCGGEFDAVVDFKHWGWSDEEFSLCSPCLQQGSLIIGQINSAGIPRGKS